MSASIVIDGQGMSLTPKETRAALEAIQEARVAGKGPRSHERMRERDLLIYDLHFSGHTDAVIARLVGMRARAVRGAIARVEGGRYGRIGS